MPTSDEELTALKERVEQKRQDLADAVAEREAQERALANDLTAAQLQAEEARLDLALSQARDATKGEAVQQGAASTLAVIKEEMQRAQAAQEAAEAPPPEQPSESDSTSGEGQ